MESTYAREGDAKNWKGKRALVKPEGSTYAGARSAHRIHGKEKSLNKLYKLVASGKRIFI